MSDQANRRGFVLMMTLLVILLAGIALAGLARRSVTRALEARDATEELQRRWAVLSCRETLMPSIEKVLDRAELGRAADIPLEDGQSPNYENRPIALLRIDCVLAGMDYELVFTDEQAKANVNNMAALSSNGDAERTIRRLLVDASAPMGALELRTRIDVDPDDESASRVKASFTGFGQLFGQASPRDLVGDTSDVGLADAVTLWGDGLVSFRRASDETIRQVCGQQVRRAAINTLLDARREDPYRRLSVVLEEMQQMQVEDQQMILQLLTDRSTCHGLWVIAKRPYRTWYTLSIAESALPPGTGLDRGPIDPRRSVARRHDYIW